ncbi:MAG: NUDIX hydrolase [Erysipelotrichaceae bacterium]|nr:NUDIX hydrolase [Erysipelotrichaceae bacterium]
MAHWEKQLHSQKIFSGKIFDVVVDDVEIENGNHAKREVVYHNGGVAVLAVNDQNEIYLVKQFRYPFLQEMYEIPAGKREKGEDPKLCGIRELKEEIGMEADHFEYLGKMHSSPGCFSEIVYLFLATGLHSTGQQLDEDEFLDVYKVSLDKALEMIENDELTDAKSQLAVLKYYYLQNKGK